MVFAPGSGHFKDLLNFRGAVNQAGQPTDQIGNVFLLPCPMTKSANTEEAIICSDDLQAAITIKSQCTFVLISDLPSGSAVSANSSSRLSTAVCNNCE